MRLSIEGIVQGVGFRPFVYRLAKEHSLTGWVMNTPSGVVLEVQGRTADLQHFQNVLPQQAPPLAVISSIVTDDAEPVDEEAFVIRESGGAGSEVQIAPDSDVCPECLAELFDPGNRRYRYPFINCTNCGPRFTIITAVPYDRAFTTMAPFPMCGDCSAEYDDPSHRRFHAQPNACPVCGPALEFVDRSGRRIDGSPLDSAISLLKEGRILAIKGLGGYHLAVDACNEEAVAELRRRKKRDEKPFALMSPDLDTIAGYARFDDTDRRLLSGPERPVVLLPKREENPVARLVAPTNGYFGVMLPYTPLHHLLLRDNFQALVMTSGNISDEPICYRDDEALQRLGGLADFFLTHNRDINIRTDDSVMRVFRGNPIFLRRSRGYAPRAIKVPDLGKKVLAVGAELKGVVCLARGDKAFLSQHVGDLKNAATLASMEETVGHLERTLKIQPEVIAHDLHPDYLSTGYALGREGIPKIGVQHHHAHLASCMAENGLEGEAIGVILDGTGYGSDGTIWGGEFLAGGYAGFQRKGHFRNVPLPGGDAAIREPYRMALSYLYDQYGERLFDLPLECVAQVPQGERMLFLKMLERRINSPLTSSCGRLFDAVAALIGVRGRVTYEGQAAIELEALAESASSAQKQGDRHLRSQSPLQSQKLEAGGQAPAEPVPFAGLVGAYPFEVTLSEGKYLIDFGPMIRSLVAAVQSQESRGVMARRFHETVAAAVGKTCDLVRRDTGIGRVALSGGVFQNKLLSERVQSLLQEDGFQVYSQRLAPPNDGGIALGQAMVAARRFSCA